MAQTVSRQLDIEKVVANYRARLTEATEQNVVQAVMIESMSVEIEALTARVAELTATVETFETARQVEADAATPDGDGEAPTLPGV